VTNLPPIRPGTVPRGGALGKILPQPSYSNQLNTATLKEYLEQQNACHEKSGGSYRNDPVTQATYELHKIRVCGSPVHGLLHRYSIKQALEREYADVKFS